MKQHVRLKWEGGERCVAMFTNGSHISAPNSLLNSSALVQQFSSCFPRPAYFSRPPAASSPSLVWVVPP